MKDYTILLDECLGEQTAVSANDMDTLARVNIPLLINLTIEHIGREVISTGEKKNLSWADVESYLASKKETQGKILDDFRANIFLNLKKP